MKDRASLVILPDGAPRKLEGLLEIAARHGVDPHRLRIELNGRALACASRGPAAPLAAAARALSESGLSAVVIGDDEVHALPALQTAGGVSADGDRLSLLVHGQAYGPPPGVPLLFVFADLGRLETALGPAEEPRGSIRQRLLRARLPVVDVVWSGGRLRVSPRHMTWRGLPGHGLAAADNMIQVLGRLAEQAGGTAVDLGFVGQDMGIDLPRGTLEPIERADSARAQLFDRYAAAALFAWERGLYPRVSSGEVVAVGDARVAASPKEAPAFFAELPPRKAPPAIPWVRPGKRSHVRWSAWPWLIGPPLAVLFLFRSENRSLGGLAILGGLAFLAGGLACLILGLRALSERERVRALPLSKIRSMPMGAVALSGEAAALAPFKAPYSHAECVWYRFEIHQSREGALSELSRSVDEGSSGDVPFLLRDRTGSVLVQPAGAEVDGPPELFPLSSDAMAVEWAVPVGGRVFVRGFAQRRSTDSQAAKPLARGDRDEVFVGGTPEVPLTIVLRSRGDEVETLSRRFAWPVAVGVLYLLVALLLWLRV